MNDKLDSLRNAEALMKKGQLTQAIEILINVANDAAIWDLTQKLSQIRMSYEFMLSYFSKGVEDDERHNVLSDIKVSLYEIIDSLTVHFCSQKSMKLYYTTRTSYLQMDLSDMISSYVNLLNKRSLLLSVETAEQNLSAIKSLEGDMAKAETDIFRKIWTTLRLSPDVAGILTDAANNPAIPPHALCLVTSALFLALLEVYDERKLLTLLSIYSSSAPLEVRLRALVGAALAMFVHDRRVSLSRSVGDRIAALADEPVFISDIETIFIRLVKARNTQNLANKMQTDFLPSIKSLQTDIFKDLKDVDPADLAENPEWQEKLEDSGLARKMEELNEIQMQGGDVLIAAFSHLKSFPFFNTISNWFLPFHKSASIIDGKNDELFFNALSAVPYMCHSDKYSAFFSMRSASSDKYSAMMGQLSSQSEAINEEIGSEIDASEKQRDSIINLYIQDLYRFFNLFSRRRDFYQLFGTKFNLLTVPPLAPILDNERMISLIAEFYFKNKFFDDAIYYFNRLLEHKPADTPLILQKIGFAYQNKGQFQKALDYYSRYELAFDGDLWNTKHIASCYSSLKDHKRALDYYRKADSIAPDNIAVNLNIGHCLLELGQVEEALKYYFKTSFLNDSKHKSWRPIAWCSFLNGNYEQSCKYYSQIVLQDSPSVQDLLNYGHALLASGNHKDAIARYHSALMSLNGDFNKFVDMFRTDIPVLADKQVPDDVIALAIDSAILQYKNNSTQQ